MIKRLIGLAATAAIIALLVVTILHRDRYRSICFGTETTLPAAPQSTTPDIEAEPAHDETPDAEAADSTQFAAPEPVPEPVPEPAPEPKTQS